MNLQFNVDQIAEHVTAGIQAQAAANQAARIGERFTGPVVQAILDESCRSGAPTVWKAVQRRNDRCPLVWLRS